MANPRPNRPKVAIGGRPKGSVTIASREAWKRLEELGFDPIHEMIKLKERLEIEVAKLRLRPNASVVAISSLENTIQKCVTDLMRYGYARTTESTEVITPEVKPFNIILTNEAANSAVPTEASTLKVA